MIRRLKGIVYRSVEKWYYSKPHRGPHHMYGWLMAHPAWSLRPLPILNVD